MGARNALAFTYETSGYRRVRALCGAIMSSVTIWIGSRHSFPTVESGTKLSCWASLRDCCSLRSSGSYIRRSDGCWIDCDTSSGEQRPAISSEAFRSGMQAFGCGLGEIGGGMALDRREQDWADSVDIGKVKFGPQISRLEYRWLRFLAFWRRLFGRKL